MTGSKSSGAAPDQPHRVQPQARGSQLLVEFSLLRGQRGDFFRPHIWIHGLQCREPREFAAELGAHRLGGVGDERRGLCLSQFGGAAQLLREDLVAQAGQIEQCVQNQWA